MENHSFSSYPDSGNSSPRSREIETENPSWDELPPPNYRVRLMCSYGGKIQPRPHDNHLFYVGGDTKIVGVDRHIKFSSFTARLSSLCDSPELCVKYQLPGEDLDALISLTNDEDLDHMMVEYDRLHRSSTKPVRLRLFVFPVMNLSSSASFRTSDTKSEGQWFVDALNSVQIQNLESSSTQSAPELPQGNPDFLFGLDKGLPSVQSAPEIGNKDVAAGSECGSEDQHLVRDPVMSPAEIQRQIQESRRTQAASPVLQTRVDDGSPKVPAVDYYGQRVAAAVPLPTQVQLQVQVPAPYLQERHLTTGSYAVSGTGNDGQPLYYVPAAAVGAYLAPPLRPMTGYMGQPIYGVHRMVPEGYAAVPPQPPGQQQHIGVYAAEGAPAGFTQMAYDTTGRHVYYTTQGGEVPGYQARAAVVAVDGRQGGGALNQEGKVLMANIPQNSSA